MIAMRGLPIEPGNAPRNWPFYVAAAVLGLGLAIGMTAHDLLKARDAAIAEAKAWTISGRPCPQLPIGEIARQPYAGKSFGYAGSGFAYAYGHVACAQIHADAGKSLFRGYPVCQFTSPGVVVVRAGGTASLFAPGLGQRATVSAPNGEAQCVMAARFYGQADF
jgi:hypothetical protein